FCIYIQRDYYILRMCKGNPSSNDASSTVNYSWNYTFYITVIISTIERSMYKFFLRLLLQIYLVVVVLSCIGHREIGSVCVNIALLNPVCNVLLFSSPTYSERCMYAVCISVYWRIADM